MSKINVVDYYLQQFLLEKEEILERQLEPELVEFIKRKEEEGCETLYAKYGTAFLDCRDKQEIIVCTFRDGEILSIPTSRNEMATAVAHWDLIEAVQV